jgi:hypothetical protein
MAVGLAGAGRPDDEQAARAETWWQLSSTRRRPVRNTFRHGTRELLAAFTGDLWMPPAILGNRATDGSAVTNNNAMPQSKI